jgi:hypothetical protein
MIVHRLSKNSFLHMVPVSLEKVLRVPNRSTVPSARHYIPATTIVGYGWGMQIGGNHKEWPGSGHVMAGKGPGPGHVVPG